MSKSAWKDILKQINEAIQLHLTQAERDATWILGVSGGADSIALLHGIFEVHKQIVVAHVNYGKRDEASDLDETFVKATCAEMKVPFRSMKAPKVVSGNFQASARAIRYQFFEECAQEFKAQLFVLAQHKDDQEENLIFRTLRGSNAKAILGPSIKEGNRFRPLLNIRKQDLIEGLREQHIEWREDESNKNSIYSRNWLRNECIPEFSKRFPGWAEHLQQKAHFEKESLSFIEVFFKDDVKWINHNTLSISLDSIDRCPPTVLQFLIHFKLNEKKVYISSQSLIQLLDLKTHQKGKKIAITEDWIALREADSIVICTVEESIQTQEVIHSSSEWDSIERIGYQFSHADSFIKVPGVLSIDLEKMKFPVTVRNWKSGDTLNPFGMKGTKLVSDLITMAKVPNQIKDQILVLQDFDEAIHAVIFPPLFFTSNRSSELSKVSDQTRMVAQIKPHTI